VAAVLSKPYCRRSLPNLDRRHPIDTADPCVLPTRNGTQIDLATGQYNLQLILSDGKEFGRVSERLLVDSFDAKRLAMSSLMLCKRFRDAGAALQEAGTVNLAPRYRSSAGHTSDTCR